MNDNPARPAVGSFPFNHLQLDEADFMAHEIANRGLKIVMQDADEYSMSPWQILDFYTRNARYIDSKAKRRAAE